jgi:hypothetical protein
VEFSSGHLRRNELRHTLTLRTTHDMTPITQLKTLVVVEVRKCRDRYVCNRVTKILRGLGLGFHPLSERSIGGIVTNTLAEWVEFPDLTFIERGLIYKLLVPLVDGSDDY